MHQQKTRFTYVVVVLLHGDYPWNVVKSNRAKAEVGIIRDFEDFLDKEIDIWGGHAINGGDEVGGRKSIMVRW